MTCVEYHECSEPSCRFRFPAVEGQMRGRRCPWCGAPTNIVHRLLAASEHVEGPPAAPTVPRLAFAALLDNVRSVFNVGSIFRSADGVGMTHLYLCGVTPAPDNRKLAKTALGAERSVAWSHHRNSIDLARRLRSDGWRLWALEVADGATPIDAIDTPPLPLVLVAGSEIGGIDPDLLGLCERCVYIPMAGQKQSLNVATAFGVAALLLRQRMQPLA